MESKKRIQINLFTKQITDSQTEKQTYGYQRGKGQRRDRLGAWEHTTICKID